MATSNFITVRNEREIDIWVAVSSDRIQVKRQSRANSSSDSESSSWNSEIGVNGETTTTVGGNVTAGKKGGITVKGGGSSETASQRSASSDQEFAVQTGPEVSGFRLPPGTQYDLAIQASAKQYFLLIKEGDTIYSENQSFDVATQNFVVVNGKGVVEFENPDKTLLMAMSTVSILFGSRWLATPVSAKNWPAANLGASAQKHIVVRVEADGQPETPFKPKRALRSGDYVRIITLDTTDEGYNQLYSSKKGWAYYDKARKGHDKQIWRIHVPGAADKPVASTDDVFFTNKNWPDARLRAYDDEWMSVEDDPAGSIARLTVHQTGFS
ncbi:hypothetical protein [Jannaschia sp. LMIT008]|uniref:hypothetical protein n=1 Tax=Jannaschia maritima TaxID=3032585 RepID=UPI002811330E|nr:hypothetical protein [Jannaschia sp. LMIT008]